MNGGLRAAFALLSLRLVRARPAYVVQLVSHKILRRFVPFFLATMFVASVFGAGRNPVWWFVLGPQLLFYALAAAGAVAEVSGRRSSRAFSVPYYFSLANIAAALAVLSLVAGVRYEKWESVDTRAVVVGAEVAVLSVRPARTGFKRTAERTVAKFAAGTRSGKRVVVLGYHSVHPSAPYASASPAEFAAHLDWLVEHCDVVDLASVRGEAPAPGRPRVAITFDDGFVDNFTNAFPMLAARGLAATFFLTTGFIERDPVVLGRMARLWGVSCGDVEPLSWSQAREMASQGMSFGSHTQSHPNLAELNAAAAVRELRISKDRIEQELGHRGRRPCVPVREAPSTRQCGDRRVCARTALRSRGHRHAACSAASVMTTSACRVL